MRSLSRRRLLVGATAGAALLAACQASPGPTAAPQKPADTGKPAAVEATKPAPAAPAPATSAAAPKPAAEPTKPAAAAPSSGGQVKTLTYFPGPDDVKSVNRR